MTDGSVAGATRHRSDRAVGGERVVADGWFISMQYGTECSV